MSGRSSTFEMTMKKIVPDPPTDQPLFYFITPEFSRGAAIARVAGVMERLSENGERYLNAETDEDRAYILETMDILTELLSALVMHLRALESTA